VEDQWFEANRAMWDERVPIHVSSDFYDVDRFRRGEREAIESWEADELGDVEGKTLLHLQCHFGLDTLSWARRGATVTGLDFSLPAIEAARRLATEIGVTDAEFVHANVYDAVEALGGRRFDVVYTGKGAICWLPDIDRWAHVCAALVAPGGTFYLSEFHPFTNVFGWHELAIESSYFRTEPEFDDEPGTYTDTTIATTSNASYLWFHPLGRVLTALIGAGFHIELVAERDHTLFQRFDALEHHDDGTYRFPEGMPSLPLMFSVRARRDR
jgi:2-polyprenyl-3-methyl-5-hydroxy-6-metoxy-1,4-benzoquinol methylase